MMAEKDPPTHAYRIGITGCPELNIGISHGCHQNIVLHAGNFRPGGKASVRRGSSRLHEVVWTLNEFPASWRHLANESVGVFTDLQRCDLARLSETAARQTLLKFSRQYRSCLRASMESVPVSSAGDETQLQRQVIGKMELIWNLCEIILVEEQRSGVLLYQLLEWVKEHATQFDRSAAELNSAEVPESHPEFWNTVYGYTMQGRLDAVRKLLRLHSSFGTDPFISADELLRKMPLYAGGALALGAAGLADFELRWRHWQSECVRRLEQGEFSFSSRLQTLVKLLCGDAPTFEENYQLLGTWYHLMVSFLLYTRPWVSKFDLRCAAEDSIEVFGGRAERDALDVMLQAILDNDVHLLIKTAHSTFSDGWLASHLADLLYHTLGSEPSYLAQLREHLLLEYAGGLMAQPSLWQLGVPYLDACPQQGRAHLTLLLERLEPGTDARARKIIQVAESRALSDVVCSVARVMGRRAQAAGQLGTALAWALRSEDSAFAAQLADTLVQEYAGTGEFSSTDFIDNLGSSMLISDRLMFLGKYREFHRLFEEGDMAESASLLVSLMTSQLAPKYMWMTLLTDAVSLLDSSNVVISSEQTYQLMDCLEQLKRGGDLDEGKDEVKLIRLRLSRNLARAIIKESSAAS